VSDVAPEAGPSAGNPTEGSPTPVATPPSSGGVSIPPTSGDAARAREWQSKYDQADARAKALESRLAALESAPPAPTITREDVGVAAAEAVMRVSGLMKTEQSLREKYPDVARLTPTLFDQLHTYANPEEFVARVEQENERLAAVLAPYKQEAEATVLKRYEDKYGPIAPPAQTEPAEGELTLDQMAEMTLADIDAYEQQHGEGTYLARFNALQQG
jgi:hypothetical protein